MSEMIIRKAKLEDVSEIFNLVQELAIFEKEPNAIKISVQDYISAFNEGLIDAIVAEKDTRLIGITVFYMTFSTWNGKCLYLEDFYVQPEHRKTGIGQQLFDAYLMEARRREANLTKWQVLDWNETGLNFYKKNKATIESNWWNGKIYFNKIQE